MTDFVIEGYMYSISISLHDMGFPIVIKCIGKSNETSRKIEAVDQVMILRRDYPTDNLLFLNCCHLRGLEWLFRLTGIDVVSFDRTRPLDLRGTVIVCDMVNFSYGSFEGVLADAETFRHVKKLYWTPDLIGEPSWYPNLEEVCNVRFDKAHLIPQHYPRGVKVYIKPDDQNEDRYAEASMLAYLARKGFDAKSTTHHGLYFTGMVEAMNTAWPIYYALYSKTRRLPNELIHHLYDTIG